MALGPFGNLIPGIGNGLSSWFALKVLGSPKNTEIKTMNTQCFRSAFGRPPGQRWILGAGLRVGVRVGRPFGARRRSSVRYGTRLGDLKESWLIFFSNLTLNTHQGLGPNFRNPPMSVYQQKQRTMACPWTNGSHDYDQRHCHREGPRSLLIGN